MHITPTTGPSFTVAPSDTGRRAMEPRDALARRLTGLGLREGGSALDLRSVLYATEPDPNYARWDADEILARIDCLGDVRLAFGTRMAHAKPVHEVAHVVQQEAAPAPVRVLPMPTKKKAAAADPGPAARAFQNASRTGAATVCKGPCEACDQA